MTTAQKRSEILEQLAKADDRLLDKIEAVILDYKKAKTDPYDALPEVAQMLLQESENEFKKGTSRLHKDVLADAKQKYGTHR